MTSVLLWSQPATISYRPRNLRRRQGLEGAGAAETAALAQRRPGLRSSLHQPGAEAAHRAAAATLADLPSISTRPAASRKKRLLLWIWTPTILTNETLDRLPPAMG